MAVALYTDSTLESIPKKVAGGDGCGLVEGDCHSLEMADAKSGVVFSTNEKRPPGNERIVSSKNN